MRTTPVVRGNNKNRNEIKNNELAQQLQRAYLGSACALPTCENLRCVRLKSKTLFFELTHTNWSDPFDLLRGQQLWDQFLQLCDFARFKAARQLAQKSNIPTPVPGTGDGNQMNQMKPHQKQKRKQRKQLEKQREEPDSVELEWDVNPEIEIANPQGDTPEQNDEPAMPSERAVVMIFVQLSFLAFDLDVALAAIAAQFDHFGAAVDYEVVVLQSPSCPQPHERDIPNKVRFVDSMVKRYQRVGGESGYRETVEPILAAMIALPGRCHFALALTDPCVQLLADPRVKQRLEREGKFIQFLDPTLTGITPPGDESAAVSPQKPLQSAVVVNHEYWMKKQAILGPLHNYIDEMGWLADNETDSRVVVVAREGTAARHLGCRGSRVVDVIYCTTTESTIAIEGQTLYRGKAQALGDFWVVFYSLHLNAEHRYIVDADSDTLPALQDLNAARKNYTLAAVEDYSLSLPLRAEAGGNFMPLQSSVTVPPPVRSAVVEVHVLSTRNYGPVALGVWSCLCVDNEGTEYFLAYHAYEQGRPAPRDGELLRLTPAVPDKDDNETPYGNVRAFHAAPVQVQDHPAEAAPPSGLFTAPPRPVHKIQGEHTGRIVCTGKWGHIIRSNNKVPQTIFCRCHNGPRWKFQTVSFSTPRKRYMWAINECYAS
eukprot:TRINITY_DN10574_c0_g1_i1.p1 TRINITY_DN10574_c0_g1~~TRINITY_DN10574_c0_g1_i1.p1  ORF type:complete len:656 (+),score=98.26 TRINITY_DN10574_c0_g1_i1:39-2006(+)